MALRAYSRPCRTAMSLFPVGLTCQKLSGNHIGWSLALSFTNGSVFVAGSRKRLIFSSVDASRLGAEYANRKKAVGLADLACDLIVCIFPLTMTPLGPGRRLARFAG